MIEECDTLKKIFASQITNLKNDQKVSDSIIVNLERQVKAAMEMTNVVTDQKTLVLNDYYNLQQDYQSLVIKNERQKKLTTGLIIGGSITICVAVPVIMYLLLK